MFAGRRERLRYESLTSNKTLGDSLSVAMHLMPVAKGNAVKDAVKAAK